MRRTLELLGRDAELAELRAALDSPGGLVLLAGEAGIGKSRLAREAAALAGAEGRPVVWGRPEEVSRPGPFALVLDLIESLALAAGSPAAGSAVAGEARALAEEIAGAAPEGSAGDSQPVRRIAARLRGLLGLLGERPLAIAEDLHAADEASHAVIVHLARSAPDDSHLLLGTYRPEEAHASDPLGRFLDVVGREGLAREIHLRPLDAAATAALIAQVMGSEPDPAQVERIVALGEGIPFFIEEMASARAQGAGGAVPGGISRAVLARRARLDPEAARIVSAAALMAGSIDVRVLASALGTAREEVARALASAARAGLVEDREGRLVFRHALVRDALASDLVSVEAAETHRRLAEVLERAGGEGLAPVAGELARHWYEARDRDRARGYALKAGERALHLGAPRDARQAYELALACAEDPAEVPEALAGLGEVEIRLGAGEEAEKLLRRASESFRARGQIGEAAEALGRVAWVRRRGLRPDSPAVLDEALDLLADGDFPLQRGKLLVQKGKHLFDAERFDAARAALEEATGIGERLGDHGLRAEALALLAWVADLEPGQAKAVQLAEEALAEALLGGQPEVLTSAHWALAELHVFHGRPREALRIVGSGAAFFERAQGAAGLAFLDFTEAQARRCLGEPRLVAHLVARREIGWAMWRGETRVLQAWAALHAGDREQADRIVRRSWDEAGGDEVRAMALRDPDSVATSAAYALVCELVVRSEDRDPPATELHPAIDVWLGTGIGGVRLRSAQLAAHAFLAAGDSSGAGRALRDLEEELERYPTGYERGMALELRGLLSREWGDLDPSEGFFRQAAAEFESLGNLADRARCLRLAAQAMTARGGNREETLTMLRAARELAIEAGSTLETARSEAEMRALGARPRAGRPRKGSESPRGLSVREEEVAVLVAAGDTNAEIASRLYLSDRTVQDHITHALKKLGLSGRAQLAAWAAKQGLV
ncbi:MAG: AAA family ATPase [Acidobacteria bacterium]|nr:AAA family ATPase [Acidobacteriota bacterium]